MTVLIGDRGGCAVLLINSSLTEDGKDESNLIYINILKDLTGLQARILSHLCRSAQLVIVEYDCLALWVTCPLVNFYAAIGCNDINRFDVELVSLITKGLVHPNSEISDNLLDVNMSPTSIAINLFLRSEGIRARPKDHFAGKAITLSHSEYQRQSMNGIRRFMGYPEQ